MPLPDKMVKAIELKQSGVFHRDISEMLGVPVSTLEKWFKKQGVSRVNRKITDQEREIIMSNRSMREIGDMIDMDETRVADYRWRYRNKGK